MADALELWDYRRRVAEIYARVRHSDDPVAAWHRWRADRDELFATHPQSPIPRHTRHSFTGIRYAPYDPDWRLEAVIRRHSAARVDVSHSGTGATPFVSIGRIETDSPAGTIGLTLYWLDTYGGGVFLPFRDATGGATTYQGGRYLLDSAKGADLGHNGRRVTIDFNFSYHPSCVHDDHWSCPLAPADNRLSIPVSAGEILAG